MTSSPAEAVAVSGNRVYVAAGTQGLLVLELVDRRLKPERSANAPNTFRLSWQPQANWAL